MAETTEQTLTRLYRRVPSEVLQQLHAFREAHEYKTALVKGTEWTYLDAGEGETILLLAGSSCVAEIGWRTIERLARSFRVIAPDYPPLTTNSALASGIVGLLDREGVRRVHLMGGSTGGLMAQFVVRRYPERVSSLILSHSILPERETGLRVARVLVVVRRLPERAVRWFLRLQMRHLVPRNRGPEVAMMWAHFREILELRVTKAQIIALLERTAELAASQQWSPEDLRTWQGRVLLIVSEDDPATPPPARAAMGALYPTAVVHRFVGSGHLTEVLDQDRFVAAVEGFLRPPLP
jgi:pimeloyl-ACP methyl ester carboxylesterase